MRFFLNRALELSARGHGRMASNGRPARRGRGAVGQIELPEVTFGEATKTVVVAGGAGSPVGVTRLPDSIRLDGVVVASIVAGYNTPDEGEDDTGSFLSLKLHAAQAVVELRWGWRPGADGWTLAYASVCGVVRISVEGLTLAEVWGHLGVLAPVPFVLEREELDYSSPEV